VATLRLTLPGTVEGIRRALDEVAGLWSGHGLPPALTWPVDLSLDEVLANVVQHAFAGGDREAQMELLVELDAAVTPPSCELVVSDDGPEFDPVAAPAPDTTLPIDEREVGGLGLELVRRLMDEVSYERRDGRNHLRLRRRLLPVEA
jgi:serine/threonine-protein kinase RsbW